MLAVRREQAGQGHSPASPGGDPRELAYERRFAEMTGAARAIAFSFARNALATSLRAAGLESGDVVLLSPLTCKVVPLAILSVGLNPRYVDISEDTLNLDATKLTGATARALLFQRTYGTSQGAREAVAYARRNDMLSAEDCAQCMPSAGAWGADIAIFSNNAGKPLPAGSGGLAVTRDVVLADRIVALREAMPRRGEAASLATRLEAWVRNHILGPGLYWPAFELNRRFDPSYATHGRGDEIAREIDGAAARISASMARSGIHWLGRADEVREHRQACCRSWAEALSGIDGLSLPAAAVDEPLYFFPVLVNAKDALLREARRHRVEIVAWPIHTPIYPVTDPGSLHVYGYETGSCPVAESVATRLIGLPTHRLVRPKHISRAVDLLRRHVGAGGAVGR